jgi:DNA-binding NtrC family response regulator
MAEDETTFELGSWEPASAPRRAFVAVLEGAASATVPLAPGAPVTVGRSRSCTIHVDDRAVSRLQATLSWDGAEGIWVEDHGSKNGTFVGAARVEGKARVPPGQPLRIGPASLVVVLPRGGAGRAGAPSPGRAFVAEDAAMEAVVQVLGRAAQRDATVLLLGETGVGKEVMARWVHEASPRRAGAFVPLNCGSVPEALAESTLFGHERGAFTGATGTHRGVFEQAHRGTLFLDEVGELSPASQARLLRALEERCVRRVGATSAVPVDVRLVAATHRDLPREVEAGRFREDLMYRLDVVRVKVPPLRERPDDVLPLAERFLRELAPGDELTFSRAAVEALRSARWPGNVRQLRNAIQRAVALATPPSIEPEHLALEGAGGEAPRGAASLQHQVERSERATIAAALDAAGGNQTKAAKQLGIARRTLIYKLEKYGLKPAPGGGQRGGT